MLKNITLSAEEELIQRAREKAKQEHSSLNARFRQWLSRYVKSASKEFDFQQLMEELQHVEPGRTFTRDELNER